jgi:hypothetical protein
MLRRIAPAAPLEALRTFADALDPTGIEHREVFQRYTQETELNRMADAVRGLAITHSPNVPGVPSLA